jgi:hypothetical protein
VLLEADRVPADLVEEVREPFVPGRAPQRPARRRVVDGEERPRPLVARGELLDKAGHVVVVREAVADEEDAEPEALATRRGDVPAQDRPERVADHAGLDEADVERDARHEAAADDGRRHEQSQSQWSRPPVHAAGIGVRAGSPEAQIPIRMT